MRERLAQRRKQRHEAELAKEEEEKQKQEIGVETKKPKSASAAKNTPLVGSNKVVFVNFLRIFQHFSFTMWSTIPCGDILFALVLFLLYIRYLK